MVPSTRIQLLSFAAAGAFVVITAASFPAHSDERPVRLGPVGPNEPILTTVGNKNVIAFYVPGDGYCNIYVVVSDRTDASGDSAAQVRVSLNPRGLVHIDTADKDTLNLKCGDNAATLAVVDSDKNVTDGTSIPKPIH
jgi:hypothetical protein